MAMMVFAGNGFSRHGGARDLVGMFKSLTDAQLFELFTKMFLDEDFFVELTWINAVAVSSAALGTASGIATGAIQQWEYRVTASENTDLSQFASANRHVNHSHQASRRKDGATFGRSTWAHVVEGHGYCWLLPVTEVSRGDCGSTWKHYTLDPAKKQFFSVD